MCFLKNIFSFKKYDSDETEPLLNNNNRIIPKKINIPVYRYSKRKDICENIHNVNGIAIFVPNNVNYENHH